MSKLYVGNVPEGAKEKELQELFAAFGEVEEVALLRGYGFVVSVLGGRIIWSVRYREKLGTWRSPDYSLPFLEINKSVSSLSVLYRWVVPAYM